MRRGKQTRNQSAPSLDGDAISEADHEYRLMRGLTAGVASGQRTASVEEGAVNKAGVASVTVQAVKFLTKWEFAE